MATTDLLRSVDYVRYSQQSELDKEYGWCEACGAVTPYRYVEVINDTLAEQWQLNETQRHFMSARESRYCAFCGCAYRLRAMARALRGVVAGLPEGSLQQAIAQGSFDGMRIAEINSCGKLHGILQGGVDLSYSEYQPDDPAVRHEDLMKLTYDDESFDVVLTSDTLEHVPDVKQALREIFRVLKPGGAHLFTVPWMLTRQTVVRTTQSGDKDAVEYREEASFHGSGEPDNLVWYEFGQDFIGELSAAGFEVTVLFQNLANLDEPGNVILARKPGGQTKVSDAIHVDGDLSAVDHRKLQAMMKKAGLDRPVEVSATLASVPRHYDEQVDAMIGRLANKLALTENHADNQTRHLEALQTEYRNLKAYVAGLERELHRIQEMFKKSLILRSRRKAMNAVRKIRGK